MLGQCLASDKRVLGQCLVNAVRRLDSAWSVPGQGTAWPTHQYPKKASAWSWLVQVIHIRGHFLLGTLFIKHSLGHVITATEAY